MVEASSPWLDARPSAGEAKSGQFGVGECGRGAQLVFILDRGWRCSGGKTGGLAVLMGKRKQNKPQHVEERCA